ncbi:carbohydrate sulfotransferase 9-like [Ylistrum balloti]|uniref:carbohydrate sulfotransferase 9-like n=1 Tax=Ylistrum balloti TaxID=509963 RepID=UPI0029057E65|nr:carbohydrate sulfotransferase 9-like [Ylistrum balloti]
MDQRRSAVMKICSKNSTYKRPYRNHMIYNRNKHFLFCKATKAGSTFWGRLLLQVDRRVIANPYKIKPQIGPVNVIPSIKEWKNFDAILKSSTKFIIARHPLERLYSGYVDKVFSPNTYYWDVIGKYVIRTYRKTSKPTCGHDVTFSEFLQYAAKTTGNHRDVHVASLWETCSPCHVNYDIIGQMKTFSNDIDFILDKLNLEPYKEVLHNISMESVNDALYDTAQAYIDMRAEASKCISEQQTADRIWTKLKARGFIAADLPVPKDLFLKNEEAILEIFKDAYSRSINKLGRHGLKLQQRAIYLESLRKVPKQTLTQIAKTYHKDLQMFGYDQTFNEMLQSSNNSDFSVSDNFFLIS